MLTPKQLFLMHVGQTSPAPMLLEISSARGSVMFGPDGREYIDLISGVSVSNTGHCHPHVVEAVKKQVDSYMHLMVYGEFIQNPQVEYATRLSSVLPGSLTNCYFVNSGSESVEGALKLAKKYTSRSRVISYKNSYHGSTHGALSIQGSEKYKNAFRPLLPDTWQININDEGDLKMIDRNTACVIIEPVQGEGGVIKASDDYLKKLREKCNETGALLIFDEIQTGFGRTGKMFAFEHSGVVPDILLLAKALGGGMPLGAFISSERIMSALMSDPILGHITTFGGHPVSCAAGLAALEVILENELHHNANEKSFRFRKNLKHQIIRDIRGDGLLLAVELTDKRYINNIISMAPDYGIILDYFLFCDDSFRIAPPLIISDEEIETACHRLLELMDAVAEIA